MKPSRFLATVLLVTLGVSSTLAQDTTDQTDTQPQPFFLHGYDNGYFISTTDGDNLLRFNAGLQLRATHGRTDRTSTRGDQLNRLEARRTRLKLSGHALNPNLFFSLQTDYTSRTDNFDLIDAFVGYKLNDNLQVRLGQWTHQFQRETFVGAFNTSAIDRSLVVLSILPATSNRIQGIEAQYRDDLHRAVLSLNRGFRSFDTAIYDTDDASPAITARYEFKPLGDWKALNDFTAKPGDPEGLLFGVAAHLEEDDAIAFTSDATWQTQTNTNLFASLGWHSINNNQVTGVVLQAAQRLNHNIEPFLRYEYAHDHSATDDLNIITAGTNIYYIEPHIKLSADASYAITPVSSQFSQSSLGWKADDPGQDGQIVLRIQLQLTF
ncbi:MAG: porin [Phycisphaeraceae bacterium]